MTAHGAPCAWTEVMLERLLRIDGRRLGELTPPQRIEARRVLGAAFPDTQEARLAMEEIEAQNRRRHKHGGVQVWTAKENRILRERYADTDTLELAAELGRTPSAVFGRAQSFGVKKSRELRAEHARRHLLAAGKAYRFPKGHVPWTKGRKGLDLGGRSHETRFKPGGTPQTWVPVGSYAYGKDGYLKVKVSDDRTKESRFNWRFVHHLVWEEAHGRRVPRGHVVTFVDRDKTNVRPENLELITRAEHARRNHHSNLPPELAEVIFLTGWVKRRMRERQEEEQNDRTAASDR